MKLARVEHKRCGEYRASTYVWVDDDMSLERFEEIANSARDAYLAAIDAFKNDPNMPLNPGYSPNYERHPEMTVAVVKAIFDEAKTAYDEWEKRRKAAQKPFVEYMKGASTRVQGFYDVTPELSTDISWGHRHGEVIEYSEIKPYKNDFNVAVEAEDEL